ncbi:MAG: acetylornithine deacetylase [Alphaproteobacteria bacterium]
MAGQIFTPVEMIKRLVAFDTTSRESNLALIDFVADYLAGHGVRSEIIHAESGDKANLYATIGPAGSRGVALSGHTDVVPVDGQDWHSDPFSVVEADGRLYGRGTADMKSFIAVVLALVPEFLSSDLETPIHLAFSYDEEVGCLGVHGIVEHFERHGIPPRLAIVGEPTGMRVVDAHKGIRAFTTTVTGLEAHSSATHIGVNAVMYAAELIAYLGALAEEMKERGDGDRFAPPYTTVHVGVIEGGTALNIIPRSCRFTWEYRLLPGGDENEVLDRFESFAKDQVLPRMRALSEAADIVTVQLARVPALNPEPGSEAEALVFKLIESNQTFAVSYGTEAGIFQAAEVPTVVCGPGDIVQAHKPDEFIELEQVERCVAFLRRLVAHLRAA